MKPLVHAGRVPIAAFNAAACGKVANDDMTAVR